MQQLLGSQGQVKGVLTGQCKGDKMPQINCKPHNLGLMINHCQTAVVGNADEVAR